MAESSAHESLGEFSMDPIHSCVCVRDFRLFARERRYKAMLTHSEIYSSRSTSELLERSKAPFSSLLLWTDLTSRSLL